VKTEPVVLGHFERPDIETLRAIRKPDCRVRIQDTAHDISPSNELRQCPVLRADVRNPIVLVLHFFLVVSAQIILGAASAIIPPALASLSLGLVGRELFPARISRNEGFNHGGNFTGALLAGTVGQWLGYHWLFYFLCMVAVASACIVAMIRLGEINHEAARSGMTKRTYQSQAGKLSHYRYRT
jgi:hypothetical protein